MPKHFVKSDIISIGTSMSYVVGNQDNKRKIACRESELLVGGKPGSQKHVILKPNGKGLPHVRKTKFRGLPLNIEFDVGMTASGKDPDGKEWSTEYKNAYGEIDRTEGRDKDPVDIYLGPDKKADRVFIVHQVKKEGSYDEDKCFLGFKTMKQATKCYFDHGPKWGFGSAESMTFDQFKNGYLASNRREGFRKSAAIFVRGE